MAAQPPSSRTYSIGDGNRFRQGKPLEHTARAPSSALVQQLDVVVVTGAARAMDWVGKLPRICYSERAPGKAVVIGPGRRTKERSQAA